MLRNLWNRVTRGRKTSRRTGTLKHRALRVGVEPLEQRRLLAIIEGPYPQLPADNAMTILWETDNQPNTNTVYYRVDGTSEWSSASGGTNHNIDGNHQVHEIPLSSLSAATTYEYKVKSDAIESGVYEFTTAPSSATDFRFVAYGDTRTNEADHQAVINGILGESTLPSLVLHVGDVVESGPTASQWDAFFNSAEDLIRDEGVPMIPVWGNHDTGANTFFDDYFALPNNEQWFAFTYSNVRFVGLDTTATFTTGSTQYNWLMSELDSAAYRSAQWHVVFMHHPAYTNPTTEAFHAGHTESETEIANVRTYLEPLFEMNGVDVVFTGHNHIYERFEHNGVNYIISGNSGAPLHDSYPDTTDPVRIRGESVLGYCTIDVDVSDGTLTVLSKNDDGTTFDTLVLDATSPVPTESEPFAIAMLTDTQNYVSGDFNPLRTTYFEHQTEWIANHAGVDNIEVVTHVGDIVEHDTTEDALCDAEWDRAAGAMATLDGHVPYNVAPGNHDYDVKDNHANYTHYTDHFGDLNQHEEFSAGGYDFLQINLEWRPRQSSIDWAIDTIEAHPNRAVILTTHEYLDINGNHTTGGSENYHTGNMIYDELVEHYGQIFMVLCGHVAGRSRNTVHNAYGQDVFEMLADYQSVSNGGNGYFRLIKFEPAWDRIDVNTITPYYNGAHTEAYSATAGDNFELQMDFSDRLNFNPRASLTTPADNGASDYNKTTDKVLVAAAQSQFVVQLSSISQTIDDSSVASGGTVLSGVVELTKDGIAIPQSGEGFAAAYDSANDRITITMSDSSSFGTGAYQITLNDIEDSLGVVIPEKTIAVTVEPSLAESTLVANGSSWYYLDNGSDQGTAWRETDFTPSTPPWEQGSAHLGYGDGGETTTVHTIDAHPEYAGTQYNFTTYFRQSFNVTKASYVESLKGSLVFDDGAVVYLNGTEVARFNMEVGEPLYTTAASVVVSGADEHDWHDFNLDASLLVDGTNVIAVEVHQCSHTSSDISFDFKLTGMVAKPTHTFSNGVLTIFGTTVGETITVAADPASKHVSVNGTALSPDVHSDQVTELYVYANGGDDTIDLRGVTGANGFAGLNGKIGVFGDNGFDLLYGSPFAQVLNVGGSDDTAYGGDGNDTIVGSEGPDLLVGGGGDDSIVGLGGNDTIEGGTANDTLVGGLGNDSLLGEAGADSILGEAGDDTLVGGTGDDTLRGGANNDTFVFSGTGLGADKITETAADGGTDLLDFSGFGAAITTLNLGSTSAQTVNSGNLTLTLSDGSAIENVIGSANADNITGNSLANKIWGGAGADTIYGGTGADTIEGEAGADRLYGDNNSPYGSGGNDLIIGGDGSDTCYGDGGNDTIYGDDVADSYTNADLLYGDWGYQNDSYASNAGGDLLVGGKGNDSIYGEYKGDTLSGGDGADLLSGDYGSYAYAGNDSIVGGDGSDTCYGAGGSDTIYGDDVADSYTNADLLYGDWGYQNDSYASNAGADSIVGGKGNDSIFGEYYGDTLSGGDGADYILGDYGSYASYAYAGNDSILGGAGDDTIYGCYGSDTILGGADKDLIYGDYSYWSYGVPSGNDSIDAGDGDDTVYGGYGADTIMGGAGADLVFANDGSGDDSVNGGDGDDTLYHDATDTYLNFEHH